MLVNALYASMVASIAASFLANTQAARIGAGPPFDDPPLPTGSGDDEGSGNLEKQNRLGNEGVLGELESLAGRFQDLQQSGSGNEGGSGDLEKLAERFENPSLSQNRLGNEGVFGDVASRAGRFPNSPLQQSGSGDGEGARDPEQFAKLFENPPLSQNGLGNERVLRDLEKGTDRLQDSPLQQSGSGEEEGSGNLEKLSKVFENPPSSQNGSGNEGVLGELESLTDMFQDSPLQQSGSGDEEGSGNLEKLAERFENPPSSQNRSGTEGILGESESLKDMFQDSPLQPSGSGDEEGSGDLEKLAERFENPPSSQNRSGTEGILGELESLKDMFQDSPLKPSGSGDEEGSGNLEKLAERFANPPSSQNRSGTEGVLGDLESFTELLQDSLLNQSGSGDEEGLEDLEELAELFGDSDMGQSVLPNKNSVDRPNIIYILADDMGYHDVGFQNSDVISPTLDALAHEGVILDQAYAQSICTPSRAALMTSIYPYKSKMQHSVVGDLNPACTPLAMKFLPERLKDLGYATHMLGKWHLGFCREECLPTRRGFDTFYGCWTGAETFYTHIAGDEDPGYDWRNQEEVDVSANGTYHSDLLSARAVELIEGTEDGEPFFMYLSYTNPHTPLEVPEKYKNMYDESLGDGRRTYLGMVTAMDDSVGVVMDALRRTGKDSNTIIVFSSDNGGDSHGYADSGPLRSFKGSMFEGGSRVPMFINAPSLTKTGYRHDGLFHIADWGPTLMSMIGAPIDSSEVLDGIDQSSMLLSGAKSDRQEIVYNIDLEDDPYFGQMAIRMGDWKLIWGPEGWTDGRGLGNAVLFFKSEENQRLIEDINTDIESMFPNPERRKRDAGKLLSRKRRGYVSFTYQDVMDMQTIFRIKNVDTTTMDPESGFKYLFNLREDPGEYNNLAKDPQYHDKIMSMVYRVRDLCQQYVKPEAVRYTFREEAKPIYNDGTYETGWCEDVEMLL